MAHAGITTLEEGVIWLRHDAAGRGPATFPRPEGLAKDKAGLHKLHERLRLEMMQAIRQQDPAQLMSLFDRGAPLFRHYTSCRFDARPGTSPAALSARATGTGPPTSRFSSKGAEESLLNPVDWATLEHCFRSAKFLLLLGDNHVTFSRDENQSFLTKLNLAAETKRAVLVAALQDQHELLEMLLERGADVAQRNGQGETALFAAVRQGQERSVEILLAHGAWAAEPRKNEVLERARGRKLACVLRVAGVQAKPGKVGRAEDTTIQGAIPWDDLVNDMSKHNTEDEKHFKLERWYDHYTTGHPMLTRCRPEGQIRSSLAFRHPTSNPPRGPVAAEPSRLPLLPPEQQQRALSSSWCCTGHPKEGTPHPCEGICCGGGGGSSSSTTPSTLRPVLPPWRDQLPGPKSLDHLRTRTEVRVEDAERRTGLQKAIKRGFPQEVRSCIAHGAALDGIYDLNCGVSGSCVDWACVCGQPSIATLLLELACELGFEETLVRLSSSSLRWAVVHGYTELLERLLASGADVGQKDPAGISVYSPLELAISNWRGPETLLLLRHGAWDLEEQALKPELLSDAKSRRDVAKAFQEFGLLSE